MNKSATLSLHTLDYPFETLVQRAKTVPPKLILDPEFQRKYKWDKEGWGRASKFIESCLMRIPLPSCYFAENDNKAHLVIDGVQRITTVIKFINDEFALEGMTAFPELEGKKFSELGSMAADLESTTIRCVVLRNENPKEIIAEIFSRLNKGAVELSDQEIRHALFAGPFDEILTELAEEPTIKNFKLGKSGQASRDGREGEELVLRYFAFKETSGEYSGNLTKFLDKFMEKSLKFDVAKIEELKNNFRQSLAACQIIFNNDEIFSDISKERPRQGVVYYDLLMGSLGSIDPKVLHNKRDKIRASFKTLCRSAEFKRLTAGGVQRKTSIIRRNELWNNQLKVAIGD
ncbi:protein of unknown function DUF262 [Gluconacetobacter diazotrophicus PA1 5]|uniref:DUF262 domain-containing protein n=1 Tax=Gluconacetobacter diazotrophicus TaxID=33996 RepID=UPI000173D788|nr:DUF262 domain-containing protein [Gluconacetobacter diazotrophicus]ACI52326.1 protein of unknown function DUF262 [Gluconacetobacter diazotrophicus PA1 5]TWB04779.1 uncharacterized protein DUF262 [Gluconacetobacter diazotrophicus]